MSGAAAAPPSPPIAALVLGASGYGGGELIRLLSGHPDLASVQAVSRSWAGKPYAAVHPNLRAVCDGRFRAAPDGEQLAAAEQPVVFAAMPHHALADQLGALEGAMAAAGLDDALLIDLSGDFRLKDAATYEAAYGRAHPHPERLTDFRYGLAEFRPERLKGARRIANPGCFATAIELALLPYATEAGLDFVAVDAKTGSSGSGAHAGAGTHHPTRAEDFRAYKILAHQHEAEVVQLLEDAGAQGLEMSFVPHSAPFVRGIFATVHLRLAAPTDTAREMERLAGFYADAPFVRVVEGSPRLAAVTGSNFCDLSVTARGRIVVVLAALDNLVKGMAGQAVQNMNLALGHDPRRGLWFPGTFPP